jgi:hypothetical protein
VGVPQIQGEREQGEEKREGKNDREIDEISILNFYHIVYTLSVALFDGTLYHTFLRRIVTTGQCRNEVSCRNMFYLIAMQSCPHYYSPVDVASYSVL